MKTPWTQLRLIQAILLAAALAAANNNTQAGPYDEKYGILATVNGDPITVFDVLEICAQQEARLPFMFNGDKLKEETEKLRAKTVQEIIDRKLIYGDFKSRGFNLPKDYVEGNLDRIMGVFAVNSRQELQKILDSRGSSLEELQTKAYENIAIDALLNDHCYRDIFVSPKEVNDYYDSHKDEFSHPETVSVDILVVKRDGVHASDMDALLKHLERKLKDADEKTFRDAVSLYSEGSNVDKGGNSGLIERSKLRPDFAEAIKSLDKGKTSIIKAKEAAYFIRLAELKPGSSMSFEETKAEIKRKLAEERMLKNRDAYIQGLKKDAQVKFYF